MLKNSFFPINWIIRLFMLRWLTFWFLTSKTLDFFLLPSEFSIVQSFEKEISRNESLKWEDYQRHKGFQEYAISLYMISVIFTIWEPLKGVAAFIISNTIGKCSWLVEMFIAMWWWNTDKFCWNQSSLQYWKLQYFRKQHFNWLR